MADERVDTSAVVADTHCHTGEGPLYHPDRAVVYWVDIPRGELFRYDPDAGTHERVLDYDGAIGGFTIQENGGLLLFCDRGTVRPWRPEAGLGAPVVEEIPAERDSRFNDVVAGPRGRVYAGTMPTDDRGGRLYRLDRDGSLAVLEEGMAIPNGMGFAPDGRHLYVTETEADRIYRYRYDEATGALADRVVAVDASDVSGHPDGMTVDAEGDLWSAFWNGGRLVRYGTDAPGDSQWRERRCVSLPARKVSSVTFGGPDDGTAYVTTALGPGEGEAGTRDEEGDGAGALFALDLGVRGVPEFRSQVGD